MIVPCEQTILDNQYITNKLLNHDISDVDELNFASRIIVENDLGPLKLEHIIFAFRRVRIWLFNGEHFFKFNNVTRDREFLLFTVLSVNKDMYIALILALNDNFSIYHLILFVKFGVSTFPVSIGSKEEKNDYFRGKQKEAYCKLLDYHNFNVSTLDMPDDLKSEIQDYACGKYGGMLTKRAIK